MLRVRFFIGSKRFFKALFPIRQEVRMRLLKDWFFAKSQPTMWVLFDMFNPSTSKVVKHFTFPNAPMMWSKWFGCTVAPAIARFKLNVVLSVLNILEMLLTT